MAGTLSAVVYAQLIGTAAAPLIGEGTLTAIAPHAETPAPLGGDGAITATASPIMPAAAALAGAGTLAAVGSPIMTAAAALTGAGALSAGATGKLNGPTFDAAGAGTVVSGTTISATHTATAGATVFAFLGIGGTGTISSFTYGGLAMTLVTNNVFISTAKFAVYQLTNAPGGAQTVTATISTGAVCNLETISYTGVNSVGTPATAGSSTLVSSASQAVTCAANQIIVQGFNANSKYWTAVTGGTLRYNNYFTATSIQGLAVQDSTASTTFNGTLSGTSAWGGIGIVLS